MRRKDLTNQTIETFSWLENELGYTREEAQVCYNYFTEKIVYKKNNKITITFICDTREDYLYFEIFVITKEGNLSLSERTGLCKPEHDREGQIDVQYESIFHYTKNTFDRNQFQQLKNNAELQLKKREGRRKYVEVFSQLIKAALTSIEVCLD